MASDSAPVTPPDRVLVVSPAAYFSGGGFISTVENFRYASRFAYDFVVGSEQVRSHLLAIDPDRHVRIDTLHENHGLIGYGTAFLRALLRYRPYRLIYFIDYSGYKPAELLAARVLGIPVILHVRTVRDPSFWDGLARGAERVIANSFFTRNALGSSPSEGQVEVVYNAVDGDLFDRTAPLSEPAFTSGRITIGYVGKVRERKGVHPFVEAALGLLARRDDVTFVVIGDDQGDEDGCLDALKEMTPEPLIDQRLFFTGYRHDVAAVMRSLDVLVVPSLIEEAFGRTCIEGMAAGVPVIATHRGGIPEVVVDGECGLLVPAGDVDALSDAIVHLCDDALLRRRMGAAGRARVRECFDIDRLTGQIEDVLADVMEGPSTTAGH